MTLQELDTINSIAIKAEVDFEDMLRIIGYGAAEMGILSIITERDDTKYKIICSEIEKNTYEREGK